VVWVQTNALRAAMISRRLVVKVPERNPVREDGMSKLAYSVSMSLDGFVAGLDQSVDHPLGVGGERLHAWMRALAAWRDHAGLDGGETNASTAVLEEEDNDGAVIMGRNMFGGGPGPWGRNAWTGWWGDNPPFHLPVFVLTHYERAPLLMEGGTTFTFVTGGPHEALELARRAAGGRNIAVSGGGRTAKQYLAAGLLDEVDIHLVPTCLGAGVRFFDDPRLATVMFEQTRVIEAPGVTHLRYRIIR
jgi:dihydrofolate reductase